MLNTSVYIYIYIHIHRESEMHMYLCVYIYIYMYFIIEPGDPISGSGPDGRAGRAAARSGSSMIN